MNLHTYPDYERLSQATAQLVADIVNNKPQAVLCMASGDSPRRTFQLLVQMAQTGQVNFGQCQFVGLDEWVGVPRSNPGSCYHLVNHEFFEPLNIAPERIHFFDGLATNLPAECQRIDEAIAQLGGLDLMLVGVGLNGHIALNEPHTPWHLYAHVGALDPITVSVGQKYFNSETPLSQGITLGLRYLQEAQHAVLIASGSRKAPVLAQALQGDVSEAFPASIFQQLPNGTVLLDADCAAQLS
jgi:glucosamine-6-phosphate deaminase